jgi:hypothetical protein
MPSPSVVNMSDPWYKSPSVRAYSAAVLLHVLLFVFWGTLQKTLLVPSPNLKPTISEPVRFEFVDVQDLPAEAPPETPLASHQNQVARDLLDRALSEGVVPYSDGVSFNKEIFDAAVASPEVASQSAEQQNKAVEKQIDKILSDEGFDFSEILKQDPKEEKQAEERAVFGRSGAPKEAVPYENTSTSALEQGGLQLSTYAWDFAPYMAYLKRQIDHHIFPPRAFDLGLIDGTTQLTFRIYRDGRLEGPELLGFKGSAMLKDTSLKAVELSAPFKGLPKDFPDDYLEITGNFQFIVLRGQPQE